MHLWFRNHPGGAFLIILSNKSLSLMNLCLLQSLFSAVIQNPIKKSRRLILEGNQGDANFRVSLQNFVIPAVLNCDPKERRECLSSQLSCGRLHRRTHEQRVSSSAPSISISVSVSLAVFASSLSYEVKKGPSTFTLSRRWWFCICCISDVPGSTMTSSNADSVRWLTLSSSLSIIVATRPLGKLCLSAAVTDWGTGVCARLVRHMPPHTGLITSPCLWGETIIIIRELSWILTPYISKLWCPDKHFNCREGWWSFAVGAISKQEFSWMPRLCQLDRCDQNKHGESMEDVCSQNKSDVVVFFA